MACVSFIMQDSNENLRNDKGKIWGAKQDLEWTKISAIYLRKLSEEI